MASASSRFRNTFQKLVRTARTPIRRRPERSLRLFLEILEDRTVPSTLSFDALGNLTWNGFLIGGTANDVHISVSGANLVLNDLGGETITLTNPHPASWSASGSSAQGLLSDVRNVLIDGGMDSMVADTATIDGSTAINFNGSLSIVGFNAIGTSKNFTTPAGGTVNLTADAQVGTMGGTLSIDGGFASGGAVALQAVPLQSNKGMTINGAISSSSTA